MKTERIRGRKLQRIRERVLAREPMCRQCLAKGHITVAEEVDHIIPLSEGGSNDMSNLAALCVPCHQEKTRKDMGYKEKPDIGTDGWPE